MDRKAPAETGRSELGAALAQAAGEWLLLVLLLWGADGLAGLRISIRDFVAFSGVAAAVVAAGCLGRRRSRPGVILAVESIAIGGAWVVLGLLAKRPLDPWLAVYLATLGAGLRVGWRFGFGRDRPGAGFDILASALLAGLAFILTWPYLTPRSIGGVDAQWYALMLRDYLEQLRAGVFPVYVGQGEDAFNGAIHLFRSAPMYMAVAGCWDFLTLRKLSFLSLQHAVAISMAVAAAGGMYTVLRKLIPERRWWALFGAGFYLLNPGILSPLLNSEMYMTFVASAVLPWVAYGVVRSLDMDKPTYLPLAAALAAIWMCHPPTALLATLVAVAAQMVGLAFVGFDSNRVREILKGAAVFSLLVLYYAVSMSELPPRKGINNGAQLVFIAALPLFVLATARGLMTRNWVWMLAAAAALIAVAKVFPVWLPFCCAFIALLLVAEIGAVWRRRILMPGFRVGFTVVAVLIAAAIAWRISGGQGAEPSGLNLLRLYASDLHRFVHNTDGSNPAFMHWNAHPGAGVWLVALLGIPSLWFTRKTAAAALFAAGALLLLLAVRVPAASDFLLGYIPGPIQAIAQLPLAIRVMPSATAFLTVAGVVLLTEGCGGRPWLRRGVFVACVAATLPAFWQALQPALRIAPLTASAAQTETLYSRDNVALSRYAYDLLHVPDRFSHGRMDPLLQFRLLDEKKSLLMGPDDLARHLEAQGGQTISLRSIVHPNGPAFLKIEPQLVVEPGELRVIRFDFDLSANYAGYLLLHGDGGQYLEYPLPGTTEKGFGTGAERQKTIALRNRGARPVRYTLSHLRSAENNLGDGEREYARVHVSSATAERLPIVVESWIPLRCRVQMPSDGLLETPRVWLPGYEARVDGQPGVVERSPDRFVAVHVPAGEHRVELNFRGTAKLRTAALISAAAWVVYLLAAMRRTRNRHT